MHNANELRDRVDIYGADGFEGMPLATGVPAGAKPLTGKALFDAQREGSETTHMIVFRASGAALLDTSCYVINKGVTYIVDYVLDPNAPRPNVWKEVYVHVVRDGKADGPLYGVDGQAFLARSIYDMNWGIFGVLDEPFAYAVDGLTYGNTGIFTFDWGTF